MRASGLSSGYNRQRDLSPCPNGVGAELAVIGGSEMASMKMEKIGNLTVG